MTTTLKNAVVKQERRILPRKLSASFHGKHFWTNRSGQGVAERF